MNAVSHSPPRPGAKGRLGRRIQVVAYPAATFAILLIAWQVLVGVFNVPEYILPVPTDFLARFVEARQLLWTHTLVTSQEILLGFGAATVISVPFALLIVSVPLLERCIYPVVVFFQLVPKIAIAPLFIVWFGFGLFPKVLLTFLLCFFPILVDSMTGFRALDERLLYITRSMGATRWQTFRYVRLPAAMPFIFSGLKISIVLAATGAIVGEFVGANSGLGYLLLRGSSYLDMTLIFAVLVALSAVGLLFSYAVQASERLVMPWQYKS
ncbi:MAG: ABC transporter permease [Alphaproteobacteria bacterium]|nr:ABC transporter permease [Alphaproteobacteria bacterium]